MKKLKIKKILLVCTSIVAPVLLGSIVAASCNNNDSKKDNSNGSQEADKKSNTTSKESTKQEHDHSKHDHSNKKEVGKEKNESNSSNLSSDVDKLEASPTSVVGLDVNSVDGTEVSFSMILSSKVEPNSSLSFIVVDADGNETKKNITSSNKKSTKIIKFSLSDLNPQTNYNISRVVLNNKKSSLNRPIPFQTENSLPPLPEAKNNYVNALVTNSSNNFEIDQIPSVINGFYRTLNLKFENYEQIKGEKIVVTLRAVGSIDNKQKLPEPLEVTSDPFVINDDGTAKIIFTNKSVEWKINYSIANISLVLNEPEVDNSSADNQDDEKDIEYVRSSKDYSPALTVTNGDKTINITKIEFIQTDDTEGEFTLTFDSQVEAAEIEKLKLQPKEMHEIIQKQNGYRTSARTNSNSATFYASYLNFSKENSLFSIQYGDSTIQLNDSQKLTIPKNSTSAVNNDATNDQPKEETPEEKERKKKLSKIVFSTQQGLVLKAGYHPSHYFLPENAVATDGLPEETINADNISFDKFIYDSYKVMDRVPGKSDGTTAGKNQFLITLLIDDDPIFNIEPNIFITAKIEDILNGSTTKGKQIESELSPVFSNGSAWVIFKDGSDSEIDFNSKYKVLEISVWRKPINSKEKTLIKKFTPKELGWSENRYGSGLPARYHD